MGSEVEGTGEIVADRCRLTCYLVGVGFCNGQLPSNSPSELSSPSQSPTKSSPSSETVDCVDDDAGQLPSITPSELSLPSQSPTKFSRPSEAVDFTAFCENNLDVPWFTDGDEDDGSTERSCVELADQLSKRRCRKEGTYKENCPGLCADECSCWDWDEPFYSKEGATNLV